jgi:hypothetical protein
MRRQTFSYALALACGVLVLAQLSVAADDKKDAKDKPALTGVWALKGAELKLEFADKDVLKISPHGKDELILVLCKYSRDKEGRIKAKITELEGKAKEKAKDLLPLGLEFSFQWQVKGDTAKLADVKGDNVDALKSHMEGTYEQMK